MNSLCARTRTAGAKILSINVAGLAAWIALGLFASAPGTASAIVVNNASFEDTVIGAPFSSTDVTNVPGWTRSGAAGDAALWRVGYSDSGGNVTVAGDGLQFTTLGGGTGGVTGSTTWSQTILGLTLGSIYRLDFLMSAECGPNFGLPLCQAQSLTAAIDQNADVSQLFNATNDVGSYWKDWEAKSLIFTADSTSMGLSFTANVPYDVGLDHVRITESAPSVPEPATLALLGLGLLGFGLTRRKRA